MAFIQKIYKNLSCFPMNNQLIFRIKQLFKVILKHGEAIGMINGTNYSATLAAEAIVLAKRVVETADLVAAMTIEGLVGTPAAFDADIHKARPHKGQIKVARKVRVTDSYNPFITKFWPIRK